TVMIAGYAKNGSVKKVHKLFDRMPQRNVVSWNAMMAAYAQNGCVKRPVIYLAECLKEMWSYGTYPDL
ncbi:hypothetical protein KI387_037110, partial [Taxus chinensis]